MAHMLTLVKVCLIPVTNILFHTDTRQHEDHHRRTAACEHMATFFQQSELDYSRYSQDSIRVLLLLFDDRDPNVVKSAWNALNELTKRLKKEEMETLVSSTRQVLQSVGVAGHDLAGFALPKGINAVLPIFLQGLMYGTAEQRTQAALAISDIIDRTSGESLRPFVTQITGPLIRVVSERSVEVKGKPISAHFLIGKNFHLTIFSCLQLLYYSPSIHCSRRSQPTSSHSCRSYRELSQSHWLIPQVIC